MEMFCAWSQVEHNCVNVISEGIVLILFFLVLQL